MCTAYWINLSSRSNCRFTMHGALEYFIIQNSIFDVRYSWT
jgi:hypothetical protein